MWKAFFLCGLISLGYIGEGMGFMCPLSRGPMRRPSPSTLYVFSGIAERMGSIVEVLSGQMKITEANIEDTLKEVKAALIDADVNLQVANSLIGKVKDRAIGMKLEANTKPGEQFVSLLAQELVEIMGQQQVPITRRTDGRPNTVLMLGLQGAGKTTASAKLASWAQRTKYCEKVMLVAADVYRPAAVEQLRTLGERLGVEVYYESTENANPVSICRRAFAKATAEGFDMVIFDTAGRQVVDERLMTELKDIKAAISPDEALLVVDAMTGQEAATLTARFNQDIGISGAILTKMDGDTRGGSALSVRAISGKPIKFLGVGEGMEDLEPFYPERMASRILGMGDLSTLLEKATSAMDQDKANQITRRMQKGVFDFDDFLQQAQAVRKMGGMGGMLKLIPGAAGKIGEEQLFQAEQRVKTCEKIIGGMTEEERTNPDLLAQFGGNQRMATEASLRRKALALRLGMEARAVEAFLIEFNSMRKIMRQNLKGMDIDAMEANPDAPMQTASAQMASERKNRKVKSSRGGGGGFSKN